MAMDVSLISSLGLLFDGRDTQKGTTVRSEVEMAEECDRLDSVVNVALN